MAAMARSPIFATAWAHLRHPFTWCAIASAMVRTWEHHPTSARIVEDMTRLPLVLDKIIEAKGGLVPDFEMQHGGCSKRKRSLKGADSAALRSYQPSAEVAAVAEKRRKELRQKAEEMSGN